MIHTQVAVLEAIRENPGITSIELVDKLQVADNLHVLRAMLHNMEREGLIKRDKARPKHCWPVNELAEINSAKILELLEWKRAAIERFPQLAIPASVIKAREVVAKYFPDRKDAILEGRYDDKPIMLACLEAGET